ncbi:MAG: TonB-dependent receptor, partial [Woeseiaceae bacterium]
MANSGLEFQFINDGTVVIRRASTDVEATERGDRDPKNATAVSPGETSRNGPAPEGTSEIVDEVVVRGIRYSLTAAVDVKRKSVPIVDALVAEDIGKFPDNQVAEALQRIPGVQTTARGGGEVSSVQIRGLSDVTTTVNGRNIFTTIGRYVALEDIPATLIKQLDVYKTRSPEHIARGIAGGIDIHTHRPFDFDGQKLSVYARAVDQEEAGKTDPAVSLLWSDRWDLAGGEFGALFNVSYLRTNYRDQIAISGASVPFRPPDDPDAPLERLFPPLWTPGLENGLPTAPGSTLDVATDIEFVHSRDAVISNDNTGERERPAWNLSLQFAPDDRSEYTFEAFYNGFRNDVYNKIWFQFVDWWGSVDPADPVTFHPGTNVINSRYVNDGFSFTSGDTETQKTDSYLYALRGKWNINEDFTLESELVYQKSDWERDFFAVRFGRVYPRLFVTFNQGNGTPALEYIGADPTDSSAYNLDWAYDNGTRDDGDAKTWTMDGDYNVHWGPVHTISFGVRYDDRGASQRDVFFSGGPLAGYGLDDFPGIGSTTTGFFPQAGIPHAWAVASDSYILANKDALREAYGFPAYDPGRYELNFLIDEVQLAAYAQADFEVPLENGGFVDGRFGFRWLDANTDMTILDPDNAGEFLTGNNQNDTLLPSLMLRWGISDDLLARFSYTETFDLPSFGDLSPYIAYFPDVTNIGYGTASGGNPDLKPVKSKNYDISLEWYFAKDSVVYATWFDREIDGWIVNFRNPVVVDVPNDVPDLGPYTYVLSQPDNAGSGTLKGWEFGLTYFPENLPGWLDGIGLQLSYT